VSERRKDLQLPTAGSYNAGSHSWVKLRSAGWVKLKSAQTVTPSAVLSAYVPSADGPAFMRLLERVFGADITTRTLDTVRKCAWA